MSISARHRNNVRKALSHTRVVMIAGPVARRTFLTLDDPVTFEIATDDPVSFVRDLDHAAIDEIQRVPELLPVIEMYIDEDQRPGRFLLTGSANILTIPRASESLAGRMEIQELLPLAQCEIAGKRIALLDGLFDEGRTGFIRGIYPCKDIVGLVLKECLY